MFRNLTVSILKRQFCQIAESLYLQLAHKKISQLTSLAEQKIDDKADISSTTSILRINSPALSIVINTQTPNRQLWYSSTISGPQRFDYNKNSDQWVSTHGKNIDNVFINDIKVIQ